MDFALVCVAGPVAPSSSAGGKRAASVSLRKYVSLRNHADIRRVLREGKRSRGRHLTVVYLPGRTADTRIAVIAGKKVGNAVMRNRAKRRVRGAADVAEIAPGLDLVLIAGPSVVRAPFAELVAEVTT